MYSVRFVYVRARSVTRTPWIRVVNQGKQYEEAFQGVLATGDIAKKCGDNLFLIYRQPTKTDRERATICDSDNPFLLPTKRHVLALLFSTATSLPGSVIPL